MTRTRIMKKATSSLGAGVVLAILLALLAPARVAFAATVAIDLHAVTGSTTLGSQTVTVWGYNLTDAPVTKPGGPTLIVDAGDTVEITLHNQLATEETALLFQGQNMIPDTTGAAPAGTKLYTFTASRPGTYLYEAGLLPNAEHQVAMGLYGALIVRPATAGRAYDDASTAFDAEAVMVLSEIDPALNNRTGGPAGFDMRKYAPRYFLINGKAYPDTDPVPTTAGKRVLLRYVNAGNQYHSMALLGAHQTVIALDGSPLGFSRRYVAETFGPGQTADAIVTAPAATAEQNRLAIHDGNLLLHNSNTAGSGGMLTFLTIPGTGPGADTTGPVTSNVAYAAGTLTATIDDATTGGATIQAAEYFLDSVGGTGTGTSMTGTFGSSPIDVTADVSVTSGRHILYVRGQDSFGNWGVLSSALVSAGDAAGPATKSPTLTPGLTDGTGTAGVGVHATGDDSDTGGSNVVAAEYTIDAGTAAPMTVNVVAPIASLDATILAATVNALTEGTHAVSIRSQDAAGNWGDPVTVNLLVDKTGPSTSGVSAAPDPNNGKRPINSSTPAVRVTATSLSDPIAGGVRSNISAAEAFIDAVGFSGKGIPLVASDGVFNNPSEAGYADIPLATIAQLSNGSHTIYVHGMDAAGNWGATSSTSLLVDKIPPTIVSINRGDPDPTSAASVQFLVTFSEAVTGVTSSNFTLASGVGLAGAAITSVTGSGATRTVTATTGSGGGGTLGLNLTSATGVTDPAGNALPSTGLPFVGQVYTQLTPPLYFSTFGNTNPPGVGGTADDADIYNWSGTAFSRVFDASVAGLPGGANVDGYDRVDATHFYLSFSADNTTVPGLGNVQDEDVVYYNAGVWSVYFDGTARGLTAANQDLDAISIVGAVNGVGGTLYFSTVGSTNPPGVTGTADDADIYSWNGTAFSRVFDASVAGLPGAANVDGFVRVDATHFYLSFSADNTTVPGLGNVQDEDVAYYSAGTWSVYFNGTARGMGVSGNLDVDAFDVP